MKEKILAFLKTKLSGVADSYLNGVAEFYSKTITEETKIESTLNDQIELLRENARLLQSEADRRVTDAVQTAKKNEWKRLGLDENGNKSVQKTQEPEHPEQKDEIEEKLKKLLEPLQAEIEGYKKEKEQTRLFKSLEEKLNGKVPNTFYKGRTLELNEDNLETIATSLETEFNSLKDDLVKSGVIIKVPVTPASPKEESKIGEQIAERQNQTGTGQADSFPAKKI